MNSKRNLKDIGYIFWEYYRWHILVIALFAIFVISFSYIQLAKPEDGFLAFVINGSNRSDDSNIALQFSEYAQIDSSAQQVTIEYLTIEDSIDDKSYAAMQKVITYASSQRLDVAVMDKALFSAYACEGMFADLRSLLSFDQLARLEGKLYYIEKSTLDSILQGIPASSPLSTNIASFTEPVPLGIDLSCFPQFSERIIYPGNDPCIGIVNSSQRKDLAVRFIDFLISE